MTKSDSSTGTLYLIGTPIGNLGDLSARAIECLRLCDRIACEDTRITSRLLAHADIQKPLVAYRDDNEIPTAQMLLEKLQIGESIAVVSDAGMPAISDPGFRIVRLCRKSGIPVIPVPGPCAAVTALAASGLPTDAFLFLGFLPPKKAARRRIFTQYLSFPHTLVLYESPHRLEKCLHDMLEVYGETRQVCVAKELTKLHEHVITGPLGTVKNQVLERSMKGEFVIAIAPDGFEL